tara:strand:- start:917 stop:1600 length:684 start_codon:yes stop_codon:yes gene_type:complete
MNQGTLIMVFKFFIILITINFSLAYSNIIYDKNEIIVSEIELNEYLKLYKDNYNLYVGEYEALRNIVLIKKTINYLNQNNPNYINQLDLSIKSQYGDEIYKNALQRDFIRFFKIRNEFITEYFKNEFNINDLKLIFLELDEFKVPISKNNCLTIERLIDLRSNQIFINNLYNNLKTNSQNLITEINNEKFNVCLTNETLKIIENSIIKNIEKKTENEFNKFIYGKNN